MTQDERLERSNKSFVLEEAYGHVIRDMPTPTAEELHSPLFYAIWEAIKTWDVNVPESYNGYCRADGSHTVSIMRSMQNQFLRKKAVEISSDDLKMSTRGDIARLVWIGSGGADHAWDRVKSRDPTAPNRPNDIDARAADAWAAADLIVDYLMRPA